MEDTTNLAKEERMPFDSPVCVKVAASTNREVKSIHGASEVMIDWPHARRGPVYQATVEVLEAARAGRVSAVEARDAFVAFAEHAGVLVDA